MNGRTYLKLFGAAALLIVAALAGVYLDESLIFDEDALGNVYRNLMIMLVIAVLMERCIEVFLSAWRSGRADEMDLLIQRVKELASEANPDPEVADPADPPDSPKKNLDTLTRERKAYRARSRQYALWGGMVLGIIVSAVGIRILAGAVVVPDGAGGHYQYCLFRLVDIFVTGTALAGGSEFFNQFIKLLKSIMQATTDKNQPK